MEWKAVVIVIAGLMATATGTPISDCSAHFQQSLTEVLQLKKTCARAMYKDCCQIAQMSKTFDHNPKSGIYDINEVCPTTPFGLNFSPVQARCNMESGDGGWIILVQRTPDVAERVSFKKSWVEYENGFGNLSGEFWYGLKNMHCLTSREPMEVEVELRKTGGTKLVLSYSSFKVDGPDTSYTLHVSGKQYKGSDYFQYHNGMKFSTFDRDNPGSCSKTYNNGGNWFNHCYDMHLTDMPKPQLHISGFDPYDYAELRVRPKGCIALDDSPGNCV
ncbi:fibrinogen-like protein A [Halichondria panicea]|uniref:fibrinogen-like protein A n=1 Tax=Halichondria panicea TaxID=6063 RepID=UPI00312B8DB5